jgi:pimeloyl-ACP methyl ester carboxylesterase
VVEGTRIPLEDCTLSAPGISPVHAQCGTLTVAEDPSASDGRQIELNIAVIPAVSRDPAPDPIFLMAGGPGQAATEAFLPVMPAAQRLHFKRDVVMVDQRGTGASHPLDCPEPDETSTIYGEVLPLDEQVAELAACRAVLDGDPAMYTTDIAMHDLDRVRAGLGYEQINLLGVSYGTRAALAYLRLYPDRVRTLMLDGVVPPDWALGSTTVPDSQRALQHIFDRCAADTSCAARFPNLPADFDALMVKLKDNPVEVSIPDPVSGEPVRVLLTSQGVGSTVRQMSYSDLITALIPLAIDSAARGDYQMLASHYLVITQSLEENLGMGMYFSVFCAEDEPRLPETSTEGSSQGYFDPQFDLMHASCAAWRNGAAPAPIVEDGELKAETPTLLISGEADPVTPPENAERVARLLTNSAHLVAPGMGHNNFYVGCIPDLMMDFIDAASPAGLDDTCVDTIQPLPFFLSPIGPHP